MFGDLAKFVSVCVGSVASLRSLGDKRRTEEALVNLLTIYLVLTDVLDEGRGLLQLAGADPLGTLRSAPPARVAEIKKAYEQGITVQGHRLYWLAGQLHENGLLKYADRETRDELERIVGSKFDRVNTLAGTVSALVMTTMFSGVETDEEAAALVRSMYEDVDGKPLSVERAQDELDQLENQLFNLHDVCDRFIHDGDLPRLLERAKAKLQSE